ncbi:MULTISPECIES: aspartyl-phosphate phosphatase Spo0E family protein [Paenibacillus]|uniref:aspartyl-phosphate phosphatase Spo0E family protein n=1 Tax=Paenibacillus TaxID=44249 RepID=UPI001F17B991|nr:MULTISPECIES: aspartyl-phosphate phosphatase Spo0E family protein [Paenibacillus]
MLQNPIYRNEYIYESRDEELLVTIESLRGELLEVARERSLSDRAVVELSERLDRYILLAQHKMMENLRSRQSGGLYEGEAASSRRRMN